MQPSSIRDLHCLSRFSDIAAVFGHAPPLDQFGFKVQSKRCRLASKFNRKDAEEHGYAQTVPRKNEGTGSYGGCFEYTGDEYVPHLVKVEDTGEVGPCGSHALHLDGESNTGAADA